MTDVVLAAASPPRSLTSLVPLSSPVLVGRNAEITDLLQLAEHPPAAALIEGEAGIGKSRLVAELATRCAERRRRVLLGGCHALRDPFPLGPVVQALSSIEAMPPTRHISPIVGALRPLLPELAAALPDGPRPSGDPRIDQHLLFRAARELLAQLGPTVCVLEDLHWADEGTIEFLRYLIAQLPPTLTLVATYRSQDMDRSSSLPALIARLPRGVGTARIVLQPLGPDAVRQLVAAILDIDDVSEEFARYLHGKTSGVPLAVEELVRLFRERRSLVRRHGRWLRRDLGELTVPPAIREAINERVAALSGPGQRIVEAAAVLDVPADAELLRDVAGLEWSEALDGIRAGLAAVLLVERDGRLVLRHALANQAVYEAIPTAVRRSLHGSAADALAGLDDPPAVQIAHHLKLAGREREWARFARLAAEIATARGDKEAAARYLRELLRSPVVPESDRGSVGVALGWAAVHAVAGQDESLAMLRTLVNDETVPTEVRGEIRSLLGSLLRLTGNAVAGCSELVLALDELEARPGLAALVMSRLAFPWVEHGDVQQHLAWLDRAVATAARQDDPQVTLAVHTARATTLSYVADPRAAQAIDALPWRLTAGAEGRELAMAMLELAMADILLGRYHAASTRLEDAADRIRRLGHVSMLDDVESERLVLRWVQGEWSGLEQEARNHAEAFSGIPNRQLSGSLVAGLLALAQDHLDDADALLQESAAVSRRAGLIPSVAIAAAGLSRIQCQRGRLDAALDTVQDAIAIIRVKDIWVWTAELAPAAVDVFLAAGRPADARALVDEFVTGIAGRPTPLAHAAAQLCEATLSAAGVDPDHAAEGLLAAQHAYAELPRPYEVALCAERRAEALLACGATEAGGDELRQALARFEALGAAGDVHRVRLALKRHAIAAPRQRWRRGRRGYGNELSPQQARVAELAAEGRTNMEIAGTLYLSPRTVEKHLAAAMQKLGVRSRTGLARQWSAASRTDASSG